MIVEKVLPWQPSDTEACPVNHGFIAERGGQVSIELRGGGVMTFHTQGGTHYPYVVKHIRQQGTLSEGRVYLVVIPTQEPSDLQESE